MARTAAAGRALSSGGSVLGAMLDVLVAGTPIAYAAALVGGLPIYLALRRAGLARRVPLLIGGAVLGAVVALLLAPQLRGDLFSIPLPPWVGVILGVAAAETFWRMVRTNAERG